MSEAHEKCIIEERIEQINKTIGIKEGIIGTFYYLLQNGSKVSGCKDFKKLVKEYNYISNSIEEQEEELEKAKETSLKLSTDLTDYISMMMKMTHSIPSLDEYKTATEANLAIIREIEKKISDLNDKHFELHTKIFFYHTEEQLKEMEDD
jgi:hypothetical protein